MSEATAVPDTSAPNLNDLELIPFSVGDDPKARGRIALPISAETGSHGTVVVLEVDAGDHIPLHTHTAEETLVVLEGTGLATAGDLQRQVIVGDLVVIPPFVRHGFQNNGSDTLRLFGFVGANVFSTSFDEPVAPFGVATFVVPIIQ